ncbi:MAG: hypothetical protein A2W01_00840 [Candidatus Solincola sediminis]|uniref:Transglutaminase-like domain-containing protein n=1 Tax=Candidatus Solincola sediminis TaxID=1797199 RepID=A0A1F2WR23_9ACTN|nr:MAG: hypothetical protein A2Y75_10820 [Candidatus Solincola sediminis]OFW61131.1 MAG: hypothetical protein A2W01_00840 [Candidatus Solincola sediminis]
MPGKIADYFRRLSIPREVEDSLALRLSVWAAVVLSIMALATQAAINRGLAFACILLLSLGSYTSWRRRHKRNTVIKIFIAVFTLAALASFLRQVYLQPYDPRLPLAELFLWVQVLHSYDLPRRRDLMLVLISSLILLSLAASFALSAGFVWLFLLWLTAALSSMYFAQASRLLGLSATPVRGAPPPPSWKRLPVLLLVLLVMITSGGLAIGAVLPRPAFNVLRTLPFSLRRAFSPSSGFKFNNPGYPRLPVRPPENPLEVNPEAYFGFSTFLDLRSRGQMVDLPVMKVRSTAPAYWGGMYFQTYSGDSWLAAEEEPALLHAIEQPFYIEYGPGSPHLGGHEVVQTYYLESEQPNVIFSAYRPRLIYFPSDYLYQDSSGLKSPYNLSEGTIYSAVSDLIVPGEMNLSLNIEADEETFAPYLELPHLPQRVLDLSAGIKADLPGPYQRALAIEDYLKSNYTYSLDVDPLPPGQDAVDDFLFEQHRGYCEHFASAFAVLCRLQGIPSRVVTGYATGDYNPFSGLYEVSLDDAHAWVEIYLRGVGWLTMDPTPGFSIPQPSQGSGSLWILGDLLRWMGTRLAALFPPSLLSALKGVFHAMASAFVAAGRGIAYAIRRLPWLPFALALVLSLSMLYVLSRRKRRCVSPEGILDPAVAAMGNFLAVLASLGIERHPSQTVEEYAHRLSSLVPGLDIQLELGLFERVRYGREALRLEEAISINTGLKAALEKINISIKGHPG